MPAHPVHFRDARMPEQIQAQLERDIAVLFHPAPEKQPLRFVAEARAARPSRFTLQLEAVLGAENCYSLAIEGALATDSWRDFYLREYRRADPPGPGEGSVERYRDVAAGWLTADAHLRGVTEVQQAILAALRAGATYSTAHKEGGTVIRYRSGAYVRSDYGESSAQETFRDEAAFLAFLRQFYDWQTSQHSWPARVSEYDAWKLIYRFLDQTNQPRAAKAAASATPLLQTIRAWFR